MSTKLHYTPGNTVYSLSDFDIEQLKSLLSDAAAVVEPIPGLQTVDFVAYALTTFVTLLFIIADLYLPQM